MLLKAPCKINLTLRILSKRADGYHEVSSHMRAIGLYDDVSVTISEFLPASNSSEDIIISIKTDNPEIQDGPENLAWKAAALAKDKFIKKTWSGRIDIHINKRIPIAAGLGGGSADAAAVLLGIASVLAPEVDISELCALGTKLGADIPFCILACAVANPSLEYQGATSALAEGIGELLTPIPTEEKAWVVLVKPEIGINTKEVYMLYDEGEKNTSVSENDLEEPCARTWQEVAEMISSLKKICEKENAVNAKIQLSGSGPTVFAYFGEKQFGDSAQTSARLVCENAKAVFSDCFVCLTEAL